MKTNKSKRNVISSVHSTENSISIETLAEEKNILNGIQKTQQNDVDSNFFEKKSEKAIKNFWQTAQLPVNISQICMCCVDKMNCKIAVYKML